MARVITQDMFNEAVKENMEEFGMTEEEAVKETKEQFEAQGVNLGNIVMACSSAAAVSQCINSLKKELSAANADSDKNICHQLAILRIELDKDLAVRVLAGKETYPLKMPTAEELEKRLEKIPNKTGVAPIINGLYPLLISCLDKVASEYLIQVLETLTSLTNGYPDLLDEAGLDYMIAFVHEHVDLDLVIQNIKWMKNGVTKHEKNRAYLIAMGIQNRFRNILTKFEDEPKLIVQVCQVVKKLVSDDDIRVTHGNPHEHARALAKETLCSFVSFLDKYQNNPSVFNDLLQVINALIVRDEFCIKVYEQNGLRYVMDSMVKYPDDEKLNRQCLLLLKGLAGNDQIKEAIVDAGAASLIISTIYRHKASPNLVSAGCVCISALALRSPKNSQKLMESGAAELLVSVLNIYKDHHVILKNGCMAIRNQLSRCPQHRDEFVQLGVEEILKEIEGNKGDLAFESKSVLRELGCDVKLEEPWKGEGRQLTQ